MIKDASNAIYLAEGPTVGQAQSWRHTTNLWYRAVVAWYNFSIMNYDVYGGKNYLQMSNLLGW